MMSVGAHIYISCILTTMSEAEHAVTVWPLLCKLEKKKEEK